MRADRGHQFLAKENTMDHSPLTAYVEFEIRKENTTAEQWVARWAERALDAWQT